MMVFSKPYCPYCKKAKAVFAKYSALKQYKVVELDERQDGDAIQVRPHRTEQHTSTQPVRTHSSILAVTARMQTRVAQQGRRR